jgi:hypothetical protein
MYADRLCLYNHTWGPIRATIGSRPMPCTSSPASLAGRPSISPSTWRQCYSFIRQAKTGLFLLVRWLPASTPCRRRFILICSLSVYCARPSSRAVPRPGCSASGVRSLPRATCPCCGGRMSMPVRTAARTRRLWLLRIGIVDLRAIPKTKCGRELADDVFVDRPLHNDSSVDDPDKSAQIHMAMVAVQPT